MRVQWWGWGEYEEVKFLWVQVSPASHC